MTNWPRSLIAAAGHFGNCWYEHGTSCPDTVDAFQRALLSLAATAETIRIRSGQVARQRLQELRQPFLSTTAWIATANPLRKQICRCMISGRWMKSTLTPGETSGRRLRYRRCLQRIWSSQRLFSGCSSPNGSLGTDATSCVTKGVSVITSIPTRATLLITTCCSVRFPMASVLLPTSSPARIWRVTPQEHITRLNELINTEPEFDP